MAAPLTILRHGAFKHLILYRTHYKLVRRLWSNKSSDGNEAQNVLPERQAKPELDLAKPGRAKQKHVGKDKTKKEVQLPDEEGLDREVVTAVNAIADATSKDSQKLRSDLLKKLQNQRIKSDDAQKTKDSSSVSSLLAGMKLERKSRNGQGELNVEGRKRPSSAYRPREEFSRPTAEMRQERRLRDGVEFPLFEGPSLGIFSKKAALSTDDGHVKQSHFDVLEEDKRHKLMTVPPNNAFEEMIRWTKEGKLWKFPIDNEQGMDEEARVGFHEHIFLEQHLDEFPKKGPIRHFMELVVVGLSKNPFFTAQEKQDHIAWYAEYFKDKYHLIEEDVSAPSDTAQKQDNTAG